MASLRIVCAYLSLSMISVVLFIILVGVLLRACFRTPRRHRPVAAYRKDGKRGYGADDRPSYQPPAETKRPDAELPPEPAHDEEQALLSGTKGGVLEHKP
mmetsp:Transcript_4136/g.12831  ORF Transcript_4136/g.12831 Transcript_4136/m.12831 type:complete len:100 (-) Transcript_4136:677-976(-)